MRSWKNISAFRRRRGTGTRWCPWLKSLFRDFASRSIGAARILLRRIFVLAADPIIDGQAGAIPVRHGEDQDEEQRSAEQDEDDLAGMPQAEIDEHHEGNEKQNPIQKKQRAEQ